jgi:hypothetical protein
MAKSRRLKKVGRKRDDFAIAPFDKRVVAKIIHLREVEGLTWREIGPIMGLSHQAPFLLYKRWRLGKRTETYEVYRRKYLKKKEERRRTKNG